jgi:hypothetical protein
MKQGGHMLMVLEHLDFACFSCRWSLASPTQAKAPSGTYGVWPWLSLLPTSNWSKYSFSSRGESAEQGLLAPRVGDNRGGKALKRSEDLLRKEAQAPRGCEAEPQPGLLTQALPASKGRNPQLQVKCQHSPTSEGDFLPNGPFWLCLASGSIHPKILRITWGPSLYTSTHLSGAPTVSPVLFPASKTPCSFWRAAELKRNLGILCPLCFLCPKN